MAQRKTFKFVVWKCWKVNPICITAVSKIQFPLGNRSLGGFWKEAWVGPNQDTVVVIMLKATQERVILGRDNSFPIPTVTMEALCRW